MGDLKKIILFIGMVFALLFCFTMLGKSQEDVLVNYDPIQSVRPTNNNDIVDVYDTLCDFTFHERVKKPYVLITESEEAEFMEEPTFRMIDYGTYREIDSLKCIRYKQMQWKMYHLDKLNEKSCE
jgi:hypothetical protein